jgi:hypothetical protein
MHNIQKSGPLTDPRFRIQGLGTGAKRETLGLPYAYLQLGRLKRNYETFILFLFFGSSFISSTRFTPSWVFAQPRPTMDKIDDAENEARMKRGELYYAFTPAMVAKRERCKKAYNKLNQETVDATRRRRVELWKE